MTARDPDRAELLELNRTALRVWEWGDLDAPPVVCVHGAFDHGRMFDELGPALADRGYRVVAPDLRGHGDSGRVGSGHVWAATALDLALLIRRLGGTAGMIGHSFGGGQALYVATVWPELVPWVVNIDGLGPPAAAFDDEADIAEQAAAGIAGAARALSGPARSYDSIEDAAARRRRINIRLTDAWLHHLTLHGTIEVDERRRWKADPMFNVGFPGPFDVDVILAQYRRVRCPVLALTGTEPDTWTDLTDTEIAERVSALRARHVPVAGAGHYVHIEQPEATLVAIGSFLDEVGA